jgi:hypothetical protein
MDWFAQLNCVHFSTRGPFAYFKCGFAKRRKPVEEIFLTKEKNNKDKKYMTQI